MKLATDSDQKVWADLPLTAFQQREMALRHPDPFGKLRLGGIEPS